ncbi:MAG: single-stranded-DNA-specific exonuclease RecJ [Aphanothece sp. CMT-3BRIN-NPC111]|jgi:single-stranded-DNA-specific exonuclease|nr:single-stranded-DNA-specific exonuclease RecJ [Aphanothece sp. CMT-3BRIN-NPC111]
MTTVPDRYISESSRRPPQLPNHRWQIAPAQAELAQQLAQANNLSPLLAQVLINRGIETPEQAQMYLDPEASVLPSPVEEFPDLAISVELLKDAIASQQKIAICGDYDADGMTSTALLLRALRWLGAQVDYAIPSRMKEGYGINRRIIEEFHSEGVQLILTVDNGISAVEPIARARELNLKVIITDHHDLPPVLPPADAILNPKLISESSPYRGVAGVGVAYILAVVLAQSLGKHQGLTAQLLELFTLGTIADLAPLTGVNRRWLKRGLRLLPESQLTGVQALIQIAGVQQGTDKSQGNAKSSSTIQNPKTLKPEDIGFRLGPRINAIGRLADPQIVIELLTTTDMGVALERAMQCEQINQHRQQLCEQIEREAIANIEQSQVNLQQQRVLVIVQPNWHHGVIGIVASRLLERYGVPVFIGTYEDEEHIRGSARGIPEFHVFEALEFCKDLLEKHGGHKAAAGFSLLAKNLDELRSRLSTFAHQSLQPEHLKPLISIDVQADLHQINSHLYHQIDALHPCGIENPDPVFWTPNLRVVEQQLVGKGHIKLTLAQDNPPMKIKAIAWRWGDRFPLPSQVDIAYKLRENTWNGNTSIELELVGLRLPATSSPASGRGIAEFDYNQRHYTCSLSQPLNELRIRNPEGKVLAIQQGQKTGVLGKTRSEAHEVDVTQSPYYQLIQAAMRALAMPGNK